MKNIVFITMKEPDVYGKLITYILSVEILNKEHLHFSDGQENRINGREDPLRWPCDTIYPQKLALNSSTSGGRSVGIVRLRTKGHGV
jgi:hypothetical protein